MATTDDLTPGAPDSPAGPPAGIEPPGTDSAVEPAVPPQAPASRGPVFSRRGLLTGAAVIGGAAVVGGVFGFEQLTQASTPAPVLTGGGSSGAVVPFYGANQAGIVTPAQDRLAFAAFDVVSTNKADLVTMLKAWSEAAALMTLGRAVGEVETKPLAPPIDTGEAVGLPASRLTITIGFGPSFFDDRFGLAAHRPAALIDLPPLPGDQLNPAISNGDIAVQACADDPQVAFHAVRNLARIAKGVAVLRWFQLGFGRTSSTSSSQATPRNLMGFKDGTNNILAEDTAGLAGYVWVGDETDQPWMRDGSYMVSRRIRMLIESWDRTGLGEQERIFGRDKLEGAPLGAKAEHDPVPLALNGADGKPVIDVDAHIRLAAPASHAGLRILRRGYSFTDGIDPVTGQLDAGLFFIAFQKNPLSQFVTLQRTLGSMDSLNEYIKHVSSGLFACPPGIKPVGWWGDALLS